MAYKACSPWSARYRPPKAHQHQLSTCLPGARIVRLVRPGRPKVSRINAPVAAHCPANPKVRRKKTCQRLAKKPPAEGLPKSAPQPELFIPLVESRFTMPTSLTSPDRDERTEVRSSYDQTTSRRGWTLLGRLLGTIAPSPNRDRIVRIASAMLGSCCVEGSTRFSPPPMRPEGRGGGDETRWALSKETPMSPEAR
jgi:hypothetical protein